MTDLEVIMLGKAIYQFGVTISEPAEIAACDSLCKRNLIYFHSASSQGRWYRTDWGEQKAEATIVYFRERDAREMFKRSGLIRRSYDSKPQTAT